MLFNINTSLPNKKVVPQRRWLERQSVPAVSPINHADLASTLRLDTNADLATINQLIQKATDTLEGYLGIPFLHRNYQYTINKAPQDNPVVYLPYTPSIKADSLTITLTDYSGTEHSITDFTELPDAVAFEYSSDVFVHTLPQAGGLKFAYTSGFGDSADDVPDEIKNCLIGMVNFFYTNSIGDYATKPTYPMVPDSLYSGVRHYKKRSIV